MPSSATLQTPYAPLILQLPASLLACFYSAALVEFYSALDSTDLNHKRVDLNAYRGKVVLLNFWATWCAPCQLEMPRFVAWQSQYAAQGLQVIGVSMDDDPALVRKLSARLKLNYPVVMGDEKLGELYGGVLGLPVTFLIGRNGEIHAKFEGETNLNSIEMQLRPLLNHR